MQFLRHDWPEQKNLFGFGKVDGPKKMAKINEQINSKCSF